MMRETESFAGTRIQELVESLDAVYADIEREQEAWKQATPFRCVDGCGECCVDFEPDVLEVEALYLAAWMLHNQKERALAILSGSFVSPRPDAERGCAFFDPESPYHCTVYGGRCLICRLFGYTGDRGKDGRPRWKPCKFLAISSDTPGGSFRRQYDEEELRAIFGAIPPAMGDLASRVLSLSPDSAQERQPLRSALPYAIAKILMLARFSDSSPEPDAPEPNPESPMPRAS